ASALRPAKRWARRALVARDEATLDERERGATRAGDAEQRGELVVVVGLARPSLDGEGLVAAASHPRRREDRDARRGVPELDVAEAVGEEEVELRAREGAELPAGAGAADEKHELALARVVRRRRPGVRRGRAGVAVGLLAENESHIHFQVSARRERCQALWRG